MCYVKITPNNLSLFKVLEQHQIFSNAVGVYCVHLLLISPYGHCPCYFYPTYIVYHMKKISTSIFVQVLYTLASSSTLPQDKGIDFHVLSKSSSFNACGNSASPFLRFLHLYATDYGGNQENHFSYNYLIRKK